MALAKVERQLSLAVRNDMTDSRLPGVVVGVWAPGRGSWVRTFGIADRSTGRPTRVSDHHPPAARDDVGRLRLHRRRRLRRALLREPHGAVRCGGLLRHPQPPPAVLRPRPRAEYSDSNYYLLGLILEKVTGRPAGQVITDQIITPLGLEGTSHPTTSDVPRPFARGYFGGLELNDPLTDATEINPAAGAAAGAMISTLGDLRQWAKVLATGSLLSPELQAQRLQVTPFPNPGPVTIGYGLGILKLDDLLGHTEPSPDTPAPMFYLPSLDATIVVWGNNSTNTTTPTTTIAFEIAEILFPKQVDEPTAELPAP